jgi:hypothetical protein
MISIKKMEELYIDKTKLSYEEISKKKEKELNKLINKSGTKFSGG